MRRLPRLALALVLLTTPACTVGVRREAEPTRSPASTVPVSVPPCRTSYAPPDPKRPRIALTFEIDDTHSRVTGTEEVAFTPDRPVDDVVFRLWLNGPAPVRNGGRIEVTSASHEMTFEPAGGEPGTQGTLLRLKLRETSPAGRRITVKLAFTITLPRESVDRWGHTARTAWWASAHPMLAWVRGTGWHTADAVGILGETAANEEAVYDVTVVAPFADTVASISHDSAPGVTGAGRRQWHFRNENARDVAVAAGPFSTHRFEAGEVPVLLAVSDELVSGSGTARVTSPVEALTREAMADYTQRFGPFPYPTLTLVALEPVRGAGVEYPGLVLLGSRRYEVVVAHEIAHEWFYGLVGNDQAAHPWLDEAFASYAEALVNDDSAERFEDTLASEGRVGAPMSHWNFHDKDYGRVVYAKGAGGLLAARSKIGPPDFDALLRCYINENAHTVATPTDLTAAFAPAPPVLDILRTIEALP